jgi:hypothetical protein
MPTYTYTCPRCGNFEIKVFLKDYQETAKCPNKCRFKCKRNFDVDCESIIAIGDATPKTVGGLSDKNADKKSTDEKNYIFEKNNAYKKVDINKPLPPGMKRVPRPEKGVQWTE